MDNENLPKLTFQRDEVMDYERKRYRGLDQRLVDARERQILQKLLKENKKDLKKILDVPSGYGRFSDLLLDKVESLVSCDISFHMVKRSKERALLSGRHFTVVADAKQGLPFKDAVFDGLLCMRFFHHVHNPEEREDILKEFARVSSRWVILSYYRMNLFHFIQRKLRRKLKRRQTQIKMISGKEFREEVKRAGFNINKNFSLFKGIHSQQIMHLNKILS